MKGLLDENFAGQSTLIVTRHRSNRFFSLSLPKNENSPLFCCNPKN